MNICVNVPLAPQKACAGFSRSVRSKLPARGLRRTLPFVRAFKKASRHRGNLRGGGGGFQFF